ncbi:MAG: hypothetical protein HC945_04260 [Nitrosarchaeum sp.]|nr:hypothetical protein [Nitrosarchaeum sp.]
MHYTNLSCQPYQASGTQANYTCGFSLYSLARNGTWTCNITAQDDVNLENSDAIETTVDPLFALNISPILIDYGILAANQESTDQLVNITNVGNQEISINIASYGAAPGDGLAMDCAGNDISAEHQRFATAPATPLQLPRRP